MTEEIQLGPYRFARQVAWGQLPPGIQLGDIPALAVDSRDRVYVFTRAADPVVVLEADGTFVGTWGREIFARPHGIYIGPDDTVFCSDDEGQRVRIFTPDGQHLGDIAGVDQSAVTGYIPGYPHSTHHSAPPFCFPTAASLGADGVTMFVSDGYGNARVHAFGPDRELRRSWGEPGAGPGQFVTTHGIYVDDRGRLLVSDRENERVQVFSPEGEHLESWPDVRCPNGLVQHDGHYFIIELGRRAELVEGMTAGIRLVPDGLAPRLSVRDAAGKLLGEWTPDPTGDEIYYSPHGIAVDSRGDIYVGEVRAAWSLGAVKPAPLTKFVRLD